LLTWVADFCINKLYLLFPISSNSHNDGQTSIFWITGPRRATTPE
jgi:hypothetical protein